MDNMDIGSDAARKGSRMGGRKDRATGFRSSVSDIKVR
jgi:hypothetical protein